MLEVVFSIDNNREILKVPYVYPENDIHFPTNHGTFENSYGELLTLISVPGPKSFPLESFFPGKLYSWLPVDTSLAEECIGFFERNLAKILKVVVLSSSGKTLVNMPCTISGYKHSERQNGDYRYSMKVNEYIDPARVRV